MYIQINSKDNVGIAITPIRPGQVVTVAGQELEITEEIPQAHKFALVDIVKGDDVIKYGSPIGRATSSITAGSWVHTHNVKTKLDGKLEYCYQPVAPKDLPSATELTFEGFLRPDGKAGIRNEIWILPTVSCTNQTATLIARATSDYIAQYDWAQNIDCIYEFKHPYGCSQLGADHENTQKLLAALAKHPNAAGVLILGLGCENNQIEDLKQVIGDYDPERVKFLVAQEVTDEVEVGAEIVVELAKKASSYHRQPLPLSYLNIGLKCGGSDGLSGITANPLVGRVSDLLIAHGGTSILTEVPEMFGAEQILMNRAKNREVFEQIVELINNFKEYFLAHNQPVYENPSPGNKAGGITTLEDKSLGCTEKGGFSQVVDVLGYGETIREAGLNLLCSPGNDLVAATTLAAAGCQIVLFTTGRGTPFGTCVPTLKISTNNKLFNHKKNWMDFNAGALVEGESFEDTAERLLSHVIGIASGKQRTKNEQMEFREIAIWKGGVTL